MNQKEALAWIKALVGHMGSTESDQDDAEKATFSLGIMIPLAESTRSKFKALWSGDSWETAVKQAIDEGYQ